MDNQNVDNQNVNNQNVNNQILNNIHPTEESICNYCDGVCNENICHTYVFGDCITFCSEECKIKKEEEPRCEICGDSEQYISIHTNDNEVTMSVCEHCAPEGSNYDEDAW